MPVGARLDPLVGVMPWEHSVRCNCCEDGEKVVIALTAYSASLMDIDLKRPSTS
jgi:hypothetical protein